MVSKLLKHITWKASGLTVKTVEAVKSTIETPEKCVKYVQS